MHCTVCQDGWHVYLPSVDGYVSNLQVVVTVAFRCMTDLLKKRVTIVRMYEVASGTPFWLHTARVQVSVIRLICRPSLPVSNFATRTRLCTLFSLYMIASLQIPTHPLVVTVFVFHCCLVKIDDWLTLHKRRIGRLLFPFKKCVCLHACGWKSQPWILNLSVRSYCSHANSSLPPCSNKETEETACQTRGSYFSWQVPSLSVSVAARSKA